MKVVRLSVVRSGLLYHQHLFLVLIYVRGCVDPRATVRPEWWSQWKIPMTPATFRLVAQWLNQLRHRMPHVINDTLSYTYCATEEVPRIHANLLSLEHLRLCCIFSLYITIIASQRGQRAGPLDVEASPFLHIVCASNPLCDTSASQSSKIITWLSLPPFVCMEWQEENKVQRQDM